MRKGFIFDLNKCVGCEACVVACQIENHELQTESWRSVSTFNSFQHPTLPLFHFSLACNHCENPSCLTGCPANAFSMDPIHHTVDHNPDLCIGCGYCTWTCPYDAPKYVTAKGTIEKCTLCKEKIVDGRKPNCVNLCPTGALAFDEIETVGTTDIPGFTERGIRPGIQIIPLRKEAPPAAATRSLPENQNVLFKQTQSKGERKSSLRSEWPLVLFTLLAAFLFAVSAASMLGTRVLDPVTYMVLGVAGAVLSTLHLGKPLRAWRALLNVRSSWLSREIVAYSLFLGASGVFLLVWPTTLLGIISVLLGFVMLASVDMVYAAFEGKVTPIEKSGSVVVTGLLFFSVLAQLPILAAAILVGNCLIYFNELLRAGRRSFIRLLASSVRIAAGILLPLVLLVTQGDFWFVAMFVLIGESINRAEFYLDLSVTTPAAQIERDMVKKLALPITEKR